MPTNTKVLQVAEPVPFIAGKNAVINGAFDIWQRGTSFTGASPYYTADRFVCLRATAALGATFSRQSSGLTSFQYSIRLQRDSGNTGTTALILTQCLESATSYPLAGQTVTLSFYAKCGANYSSASNALSSQIRYGTGTDQNYITGSYTGDTQVVAGTHTLTTSWQRFYITGTVNSAATEIGFDLRYTPVGTASTNDWFEVTGVQLELGSVATPFSRAGGTLQGELAACQRYYFKLDSTSNVYSTFGTGHFQTTSNFRTLILYPVPMRTTPTFSFSNQNLFAANGAAYYGCTSGTPAASSITKYSAYVDMGVTSATAGQGGILIANNSLSATIEGSAEL